MIRRHLIVANILLALIVLVMVWNRVRPAPARFTQWQYVIVSVEDEKLIAEMNEMGAQGWELVFERRAIAADSPSGSREPSYEMIFRRPIQKGLFD